MKLTQKLGGIALAGALAFGGVVATAVPAEAATYGRVKAEYRSPGYATFLKCAAAEKSRHAWALSLPGGQIHAGGSCSKQGTVWKFSFHYSYMRGAS